MHPRPVLLLIGALTLWAPTQAQTVPPVSGVQHRFAPFVDATAWPLADLPALSAASGARAFVLGFIVNDGQTSTRPCTPKWGGFDPYYATQAQATAGSGEVHLRGAIDALGAAGGRVMISFGGAANTPIDATCTSPQALADAYAEVVDTYGVYDLDFDIEGTWVVDAPSRARRVAALVLLQQMRPTVRLWFTLPVLPTGLDANGVSTLNQAVAGGVNLSGVNIMAMDYGAGAAPDPSQLGAYAISAMTALHGQLQSAYTLAGRPPLSDATAWSMVGVTPMIGVNDVAAEIFRTTHAAEVVAFAVEHRVGLVSMWSIQRDLPCPGGPTNWPQTTCSSIEQTPYAFSGIFRQMDAVASTDGGPTDTDGLFLGLPHPHPVTTTARISFHTPESSPVRLEVLDVLGRRVNVLTEGSLQADTHEVAFDAMPLTAGVYLLRLESGGAVLTRPLVVAR